ncbi:quinone oxidoreductase family protein [Xylophilus sp.]|uniref:quinone oxidoreductase family protein n=1 Tax=Xylophilus sp. TaxID=2653893 RepID=UPI002D80E68C|nr:zinc-binding dehydrogenase [Xylophilus sp.]
MGWRSRLARRQRLGGRGWRPDHGIGQRRLCGYALADRGRLLPIPAGLDFEQAAALPIALTTMHDAVVTNGLLQPGPSVLVQGASSGVGLMALQIARLQGARLVIGSSSGRKRRGRLKEVGADLAVDSNASEWADQVLHATGGRGVDLVVDQISGKVANQNLRAAKVKGASSM